MLFGVDWCLVSVLNPAYIWYSILGLLTLILIFRSWFWFPVFGENNEYYCCAESISALFHDTDGRLITGPTALVSTSLC